MCRPFRRPASAGSGADGVGNRRSGAGVSPMTFDHPLAPPARLPAAGMGGLGIARLGRRAALLLKAAFLPSPWRSRSPSPHDRLREQGRVGDSGGHFGQPLDRDLKRIRPRRPHREGRGRHWSACIPFARGAARRRFEERARPIGVCGPRPAPAAAAPISRRPFATASPLCPPACPGLLLVSDGNENSAAPPAPSGRPSRWACRSTPSLCPAGRSRASRAVRLAPGPGFQRRALPHRGRPRFAEGRQGHRGGHRRGPLARRQPRGPGGGGSTASASTPM